MVLCMLILYIQGDSKRWTQFRTSIFDDIFVNCNWVVTRWRYTFTHKQYIEQYKTTIHTTTQQFWKSEGRAPSWLVLPWHLPYNRGKSTEKPQSG